MVRLGALQPGSYAVAVLDITGREVYSTGSTYVTNNYLNLDLQTVTAKGVYILKLTDSNGQSSAVKLVRE
jgi:hypothetical protein